MQASITKARVRVDELEPRNNARMLCRGKLIGSYTITDLGFLLTPLSTKRSDKSKHPLVSLHRFNSLIDTQKEYSVIISEPMNKEETGELFTAIVQRGGYYSWLQRTGKEAPESETSPEVAIVTVWNGADSELEFLSISEKTNYSVWLAKGWGLKRDRLFRREPTAAEVTVTPIEGTTPVEEIPTMTTLRKFRVEFEGSTVDTLFLVFNGFRDLGSTKVTTPVSAPWTDNAIVSALWTAHTAAKARQKGGGESVEKFDLCHAGQLRSAFGLFCHEMNTAFPKVRSLLDSEGGRKRIENAIKAARKLKTIPSFKSDWIVEPQDFGRGPESAKSVPEVKNTSFLTEPEFTYADNQQKQRSNFMLNEEVYETVLVVHYAIHTLSESIIAEEKEALMEESTLASATGSVRAAWESALALFSTALP